ncbi:leucine-rich repeat protein [bacterium]|nr:leucine-rich repeat protein [bacterium]
MKKRTKILIGSFCAISGLSVIAATCAFCITAKYSNEASSTNATASMPSQSNNANPIATKTNNSSVNSTNNLTKTTTSSSKQASSNNNVNDNGIIKPTPFQNNVSQINAKLAQLKKVTPQLNTTTFTSGLLQYSVNNSNSVTVLGFASGKSTTNLTIPSFVTNDNQFYAVTAVAASAFYDCQLSNVNFNSNLQTIGAMAFADNNLTSLDLPSGLQSIGEKAFISNQFPHAYAVNLGPNTQ